MGAFGPLLGEPGVGAAALVASAFGARAALLGHGAVLFVDPRLPAVLRADAVDLAELVALPATLGALSVFPKKQAEQADQTNEQRPNSAGYWRCY